MRINSSENKNDLLYTIYIYYNNFKDIFLLNANLNKI